MIESSQFPVKVVLRTIMVRYVFKTVQWSNQSFEKDKMHVLEKEIFSGLNLRGLVDKTNLSGCFELLHGLSWCGREVFAL